MTVYKCMFCKFKAKDKKTLYNHLVKVHEELLPENISVARFAFNFRNKKTHGNCTVCGGESPWNENTERYDRICSEKCKAIYVKDVFETRMKKKYNKTRLTDEPEMQRKMLKNRKISGTYKWSDSKTKIDYTGTFEKDFLKFLDSFLDWNPNDIMECPYTIYYQFEGEELFYIPDFYIASINTIVEIKDGGNNPNTHHKIQGVDKVKEKLKDDALLKLNKYNYIKLTNKNYSDFLKFLFMLKETDNIIPNRDKFIPTVLIGESMQAISESILRDLEDQELI